MSEINPTSFHSVPTSDLGQPWNYAEGSSFELLAAGATDDAREGFLKYQVIPETGEALPTPASEEILQVAETRESPLFVVCAVEGGGDPF